MKQYEIQKIKNLPLFLLDHRVAILFVLAALRRTSYCDHLWQSYNAVIPVLSDGASIFSLLHDDRPFCNTITPFTLFVFFFFNLMYYFCKTPVVVDVHSFYFLQFACFAWLICYLKR